MDTDKKPSISLQCACELQAAIPWEIQVHSAHISVPTSKFLCWKERHQDELIHVTASDEGAA